MPDIATFAPQDALVVPPERRASFIVRQVLADMIKAVQADVVHEDLVEVSTMHSCSAWPEAPPAG